MVSKTEQVINFIKHGVWSYKCAAGINDAVMYPNGDVAICETRGIIGNLQEYDLDWKKFWDKKDRRSSNVFLPVGLRYDIQSNPFKLPDCDFS